MKFQHPFNSLIADHHCHACPLLLVSLKMHCCICFTPEMIHRETAFQHQDTKTTQHCQLAAEF